MKLAENLSAKQLGRIRRTVGEAFVTNELFHELGSVEERRPLVMRYMAAYVDNVYESKSLYMTEDGMAFIGLQESGKAPVFPQLKMLARIFLYLPFGKLKRMLSQVKDISAYAKQYADKPHIEVLMLAVDKKAQGRGYARQLFDFAKEMSAEKGLPLIIGTDMREYAEMYEHFGCEVFNTVTASNGVTRYGLIYRP